MTDLSRGNEQNRGRGRGRVANVHSAFREFSGGTPKKRLPSSLVLWHPVTVQYLIAITVIIKLNTTN